MNASFNLVDEPWIPCMFADGTVEELGVREALERAAEIEEIVGETPPITIALVRLLLAVLHRCFGPESAAAWQRLWERGAFDASAVAGYLEGQRGRFDLFDSERPFYQTAAVDFDKAVPVARMLYQGNPSTLFDHAVDAEPPWVTPSAAARLVIAAQSFDTGGLITGDAVTKYAKASPLTQAVLFLVRGRNAFETLMLNLHRYSPENAQPFDFSRANDAPAWERDGDTEPSDRLPDGYLDLLTWQSRRIRLRPEVSEDGSVAVRQAVMMRGFGFAPVFHRKDKETMMAFLQRTKAKPNEDPWPALGFRQDRALWRDSLALVGAVAEGKARPLMVGWLAELAQEGVLSWSARAPIDALGVAANQRKLEFWRHERFDVPMAYLADSAGARFLIFTLGQALELAERAGRLLGGTLVATTIKGKPGWTRSPVRVLADELLRAGRAGGDRRTAEALITHLAPDRGYWLRLEEPFRTLLDALPGELAEDEWGEPDVRGSALPAWRGAVETAVRQAFREATEGLELSAEGMRAVALAERELGWRLVELLPGEREYVAGGRE